MLVKNKVGNEKYLSVWWFFVIIVVAVGIVIGVYIFSFTEASVRGYEAEILTNKVADCLIQNGQINLGLLNSQTLLKNCGLDESTIRSDKYFLQIELYGSCIEANGKYSCSNPIIDSIKLGNFAMKLDCSIAKPMYYTQSSPKCFEKYINVINGSKSLVLYIASGSNQVGAR